MLIQSAVVTADGGGKMADNIDIGNAMVNTIYDQPTGKCRCNSLSFVKPTPHPNGRDPQ